MVLKCKYPLSVYILCKIATGKAINGHRTPNSAMATAIMVIPVAPPLPTWICSSIDIYLFTLSYLWFQICCTLYVSL